MKMKTSTNNLWRFYDEANNICGLTVGKDDDHARDNAMSFIRKFFDNIIKRDSDVYVWKIEGELK